VITIDADLQHPPQLIPQLILAWEGGARVVNAVKRSRPTDGRIATARAAVFNAVFTFLGGVSLEDASDFKLLDRVVVDALVDRLPERARFYRGLAKWVGYEQANIPFDVAPRVAGTTNWSTIELMRLALSALVSFTALPLRIVVGLGVVTLVLGAVIGADALLSWSRGEAVSGFATLITTMLITSSFIMISLGIIGEYIGRIFEESKRRPPYLVESRLGFEKPEPIDLLDSSSISVPDRRL
jgi:glycosyltransferase involved in cell wall biosynthesis